MVVAVHPSYRLLASAAFAGAPVLPGWHSSTFIFSARSAQLGDPRACPQASEEDWSIDIDVRAFFPSNVFVAAGISGRHDGRHPALQAVVRDDAGTLNSLGRLFDTILREAAVAVSQGYRRIYVEVICDHGRHRSVGVATAMYRLFTSLAIPALLLICNRANGRHRHRACSAAQGQECAACSQGSQVARHENARFRSILAIRIDGLVGRSGNDLPARARELLYLLQSMLD